jgi:hypothetical protein
MHCLSASRVGHSSGRQDGRRQFFRTGVCRSGRNDIEINVEPRALAISGGRETRNDKENEKMILSEWSADRIFRSLVLSADVDTSKVSTSLKDGILTIDWTDLAQLQPGLNNVTTQPPTTSTDRASRGWGPILSISRGRGTSNYRLNGISLNDSFNAAPGSFTTGNLGVDAIGEFSVLTGNFSTEYGKSSGGIINAITRSGTNQLHGTLFEFMRNKVLARKSAWSHAWPQPAARWVLIRTRHIYSPRSYKSP